MARLELGQTFSSWEAFEKAKNEYSKASNTQFITHNSRSVQKANSKVADGQPLYEEKFKFSFVKLVCKHYGNCRKTARGVRPNQSTFKTGCPVSILLSVERLKGHMIIKDINTEHNHEVSESIFSRYPEQRKLSSMEQKTTQDLLQLNVATSVIRDHMKKLSGKMLTTKDVHNLRQRSLKESSEENKLLQVFEDIIQSDPGCALTLMLNEEHDVEVIYIQTSRMREIARKFPEVLFMDSTYKCNNRKMPLSTVMAMDGNGHGRVVAHALLKNEKQETLNLFLSKFKELNPAVAQTKLFVVDKDFNEMAMLRELWPNAKIFLCLFHVIKRLKTKVAALQIPQETKEVIKEICQEVVFAPTEDKYLRACEQLEKSCPEEFWTYFKEQWDSCRDMWAEYVRKEARHFGNRTTNRVESFHGKFKAQVKSSSGVADCLAELIKFDAGKHHETSHLSILETVKVRYTHGVHSQLIDQVHQIATPYAASLIVAEFKKASACKEAVCRSLGGDAYNVKIANKEYRTSVGHKLHCTCSTFTASGLMCRHLVITVKHSQSQFNAEWIPNRWSKTHNDVHNTTAGLNVNVERVAARKDLTRTEKYKEMYRVLRDVADMSADLGHESFPHKK